MLKVYILILVIIFSNKLYALNSKIEIKLKIDEEIITNLDIKNEKKYLIFLRPQLSSLPEKELLKISKNSLIKEIIKKKELKRIYKNLKNDKLTNDIKRRMFKYKRINSEEEFINLTRKNNLEYDKILGKITLEGFWNDFIFRKFNSLVKIDKISLKKELEKKLLNEKKYEYNLSEILFEVEKKEKYEEKYKNILNYIKVNGFRLAASKYSLSNSVDRGGEIGWVKETLLTDNLADKLKNIKEGNISSPIKYPNGYLLLKINDKKEMKQIINIDKELDEKVKYETNRQLNQYSLLYYKKLKQNTKINEY